MLNSEVIPGRWISAEELAWIRAWLAAHPQANRTGLSRQLCMRWNWRNEAGQLKDMACRNWLLKLQARGELELPPRQGPSVNGRRHQSLPQVSHATDAITSALETLRPLQIEPVVSGQGVARLFACLLGRYHYLGYRPSAGEKLKYLVRDQQGRPLAGLEFGAAAWQVRARDSFIGWNRQQRQAHLPQVANNTRFLILPWVRVAHLASHVLGRVGRRISADWQVRYGHGIELLETFVQVQRFTGACYRAAGWQGVGHTAGRGRNDRQFTCPQTIKAIYLRPLHPEFRRRLRS